ESRDSSRLRRAGHQNFTKRRRRRPKRKRKLMPAKSRTATSRTATSRAALSRSATSRVAKSRSAARPASRLGALPEWNLADLYAGIDDPQVRRDLDRADAESIAFEQEYKGRLAAIAERPDAGAVLAAAVKRYEALDDLLGRLGSFAGLVHAGNTVDPARAKFYGDV